MKSRYILQFKFDANGVRVLHREGGTEAQRFNRQALIAAAQTSGSGPVGFRDHSKTPSERRDLLPGKIAR